MESGVSRYAIREELFGFRIEGVDRPPVAVAFRPTGLEAFFVGGELAGVRERFGFFNFGKLLEFVARGLLREWRAQEGWFGVRGWAQQQTARAIARRVREQWQRLLGRADPTILAVQRAVFAATFGDAPLFNEPALYADAFLVRDVIQYPAAAVAVRNAWMLCRDLPVRQLLHSAHARELQNLASSMGLRLNLNVGASDEPDDAVQLARLTAWRDLFADTGAAYRSLNRTLMNLPGRVPHRQVCNLRLVHLERPLERRLELLSLLFYGSLRAARSNGGDWAEAEAVAERVDHTGLFQHTTSAQLKEAMSRIAAHLHLTLDPRKAADVRQFVQFLADYPERHTGNVVGLAERAIRWHRDRHQEQLALVLRLHGNDTLTRRPPIALPGVAGVRFLDTVGAVCAEAEQMRHCVASYVDLAMTGNCFLFHVDHEGEEATVEVGCEGRVRQAQGPRNLRNKAARWGKRVLNRWASAFPSSGYAGYHDDIPF
jgi:PcfJ-like protein